MFRDHTTIDTMYIWCCWRGHMISKAGRRACRWSRRLIGGQCREVPQLAPVDQAKHRTTASYSPASAGSADMSRSRISAQPGRVEIGLIASLRLDERPPSTSSTWSFAAPALIVNNVWHSPRSRRTRSGAEPDYLGVSASHTTDSWPASSSACPALETSVTALSRTASHQTQNRRTRRR